MKRIIYTLVAIFIGCITSCSPDKYDVQEMGMVNMNQIKEIKLRMSPVSYTHLTLPTMEAV